MKKRLTILWVSIFIKPSILVLTELKIVKSSEILTFFLSQLKELEPFIFTVLNLGESLLIC